MRGSAFATATADKMAGVAGLEPQLAAIHNSAQIAKLYMVRSLPDPVLGVKSEDEDSFPEVLQ